MFLCSNFSYRDSFLYFILFIYVFSYIKSIKSRTLEHFILEGTFYVNIAVTLDCSKNVPNYEKTGTFRNRGWAPSPPPLFCKVPIHK